MFLPDGCVEIVVTETQQPDGVWSGQPHAFVVGQATTATWYRTSGHLRMTGLRLSPPLARVVLGCDQHAIANRVLPLAELAPAFAQAVERTARNASSLRSGAFALLSLVADRRRIGADSAMLGALDALSRHEGRVSVHGLARFSGLSVRQLERRFVAQVGVTPKMFGRIMRFSRLMGAMTLGRGRNRLAVAVDHGYFDHAHVARDAMAIGGASLRALLNEPRLIVGTDSLASEW